MSNNKIYPKHFLKNAYVYIRQSSLRQVMENKESTDRQYHLKNRATIMGWSPENIVIIDEDLGLSGKDSKWRNGFQYLMSEVGMAKAGAIFALEVSRLARNSADWHRLLEICAMTETLIIDEAGIYDPRQFNDRFLLGMKGQMSEAELFILKDRLHGGALNKARRGALQCQLPIGLCYSPDGRTILDADLEVQAAVKRVFDVFTDKGTACKVVKYFNKNNLLFPDRIMKGINKGGIFWRPLTNNRILRILRNPRYTGTYVYGRTKAQKNPLTGKVITIILPQKDWLVIIPEHGQGYIKWEEYEANIKRLRANAVAFGFDRRSGPPREGSALLQGIVMCGKCGQRMTVRYHKYKKELIAEYACQRDGIENGHSICQLIHCGTTIDNIVKNLVIEKLTPESIEIALEVFEEVKKQQDNIRKAHKMRITKLGYEAEVAQKQYIYVDPANRLVAGTLEKNWNEKLFNLQVAQDEYNRMFKNNGLKIDPDIKEQLLTLIKSFPKIWNNPKTPNAEKKRIIRLMIKDVTLIKNEKISIQIRWNGGTTTTMEIPSPLPAPLARQTPEKSLIRIRELHIDHTTAQVVDLLNSEGYKTGTKQEFTIGRLTHIIRKYQIKTYYAQQREQGKLTAKEISKKFGVSSQTVIKWHGAGLLRAIIVNEKKELLFDDPGNINLIKKQGEKLSIRKGKLKKCYRLSARGVV